MLLLLLLQDFESVDDARQLMESEARYNSVIGGQVLFLDYSSGPPGGAAGQGPAGGPALDWICDMCSSVNFARSASPPDNTTTAQHGTDQCIPSVRRLAVQRCHTVLSFVGALQRSLSVECQARGVWWIGLLRPQLLDISCACTSLAAVRLECGSQPAGCTATPTLMSSTLCLAVLLWSGAWSVTTARLHGRPTPGV
jgi:hypothetical protein